MASAGTLYSYSLYSTQVFSLLIDTAFFIWKLDKMAAKLSYSQTQTTVIASVGDYGLLLLAPIVG